MPSAAIKAKDYSVTKRVSQKEYPKTVKFSHKAGKAKASQKLPFRVKFLPVTFSQYGQNNPAPIGIAVIGINNYIL